MEGGDFLRPEPRDFEERKEALRKFRAEFLIESEASGHGKFMQFVAQGFSNSLDAFELIVAGHAHDIAGVALHDLRSGPVGPDLEGILALQFEEERNLLENIDEGLTGHGGSGFRSCG